MKSNCVRQEYQVTGKAEGLLPIHKSAVLLTGHFNHGDKWVPNKQRHKRT